MKTGSRSVFVRLQILHFTARENELLDVCIGNFCQWYHTLTFCQCEDTERGSEMKSKACRWKIKPLFMKPSLHFHRTFLFFYWLTWKCFMGSLRDRGGIPPLKQNLDSDSSNTSPVSLSLGETVKPPLIRIAAELLSVSLGWYIILSSANHTCHRPKYSLTVHEGREEPCFCLKMLWCSHQSEGLWKCCIKEEIISSD